MSYIKLNETQIISVLELLNEEAQDKMVEVPLENAIDFLNLALGLDFHSQEIKDLIIDYVGDLSVIQDT